MKTCKILKILFNLVFVTATCNVGNANAAIITSINYAFETFSPYALIRFFEFSDKEWNITESCFRDMYVYVEGLRSGEYWAVKLYDATSFYAGSTFAGSNVRIHNPNLCRFLSQQYADSNPLHKAPDYILPFDVQVVAGQFLMEIAYDNHFRFEKIQQLICFPKSCSNSDLQEILEVYLFQTSYFVRNVTYFKHRLVTNKYRIMEDFHFYVLIIIICGSLLIHLTVYLLKIYMLKPMSSGYYEEHFQKSAIQTQTSSYLNRAVDKTLIDIRDWKSTLGSVDLKQFDLKPANERQTDHPSAHSLLQRLHCFENFLNSIYLPSIITKLFKTSAKPLSGCTFCFSLFYNLLHVMAEVNLISNNLDFGLINNKVKLRDMELKRSAYLMDLYFLIHGANLAYAFLRTTPRNNLNVFEQLSNVLKLIVQKLFGLTPSYLFILYVAQMLDKYFYHNITMEIPSEDYKNCPDKMLSNILYMDTFYPIKERCMPWTWFVSLEIQFYIISCLLMLMVKINLRYALIIGVTIFIISLGAATLWSLGPLPKYGYTTTLLYELIHFNLILDNICLFIIPYLMGICLGCIIFRCDYNLEINLFIIIVGWLCWLSFLAGYIFGFHLITMHVHPFLRNFSMTLSHVAWNCLLFWTILTSISNYGDYFYRSLSFKYAYMLEKLTPVNLLLAPLIVRALLFTADAPIYRSMGQIISTFLASLILTYCFSLILYVLLDGPIMVALELINGNTSNNNNNNNINNNNNNNNNY